jgi:hypothetical protein
LAEKLMRCLKSSDISICKRKQATGLHERVLID